jgi:hypothetical protein
MKVLLELSLKTLQDQENGTSTHLDFAVEAIIKIDEAQKFTEENFVRMSNEFVLSDFTKLIYKGSCVDIFRDIGRDEYQGFTVKHFLRTKFLQMQYAAQYKKINMILGFGLAKGSLYILLLMKRIDVSKDILMLEVEDGLEVFLQSDLNLEKLPYSFRYYDFLINYIKEKLSDDRREFYTNEKLMALHVHNKIFNKSLTKKLIGDKAKLTFQYDVVNKRNRKEVNYFSTPNSLEV